MTSNKKCRRHITLTLVAAQFQTTSNPLIPVNK